MGYIRDTKEEQRYRREWELRVNRGNTGEKGGKGIGVYGVYRGYTRGIGIQEGEIGQMGTRDRGGTYKLERIVLLWVRGIQEIGVTGGINEFRGGKQGNRGVNS